LAEITVVAVGSQSKEQLRRDEKSPLATTLTHDTFPRMKAQRARGTVSDEPRPQRDRLASFLRAQGISRLAEIRRAGITAATVSRLEREGVVTKLGRGLYQLADASPEGNHSLAEAAKRVPKGVICLVSALAFHGITDQMPRRVWIAIGPKDWKPQIEYPPLRIVRFADKFLRDGVETHEIEGVSVPIFGAAKTIADIFRHRHSIGIDVAVQALKEALRQRKATPSEISACAMRNGAWNTLRPYLEALTADG
jgi:predicted transcriptional regulator of viral defense system